MGFPERVGTILNWSGMQLFKFNGRAVTLSCSWKKGRYAKDNYRENGDEFFFIVRKETLGTSYSQAGFPTPKVLGDLQRISESVSLKNGARSMVHTSKVRSSCEELGNIRKYLYSASFFFFFIFVFPSKENSCNRSNYECGFVGLDPPASLFPHAHTWDTRFSDLALQVRSKKWVVCFIYLLNSSSPPTPFFFFHLIICSVFQGLKEKRGRKAITVNISITWNTSGTSSTTLGPGYSCHSIWAERYEVTMHARFVAAMMRLFCSL